MRGGFSLVELSIVLVIIGLITGGILTGQALIRGSELRSINVEVEEYKSAVNAFQDTYMALPGDLHNATDYWGAAKAGGGCNTTTAGSGLETCNGNGNRRINDAGGAGEYGEMFTFWQQLAAAKILEGNYSGMAGSGGVRDHEVGINAPKATISDGVWCTFYRAPGANQFVLDYGNTLQLGEIGSATSTPSGDLMTPKEMWSIDSKFDDGKPAKGKIVNLSAVDDCTDANSTTDYSADYELNDDDKECFIIFRNAF